MDKRRREKRIALAKDVIAQIEMKRIIVTRGHYIYSDYIGAVCPLSAPVACQVCAIGSMFLVHMNQRLTLDDAVVKDGYQMVRALHGMFTGDELRELEMAFEGDHQTRDRSDQRWFLEYGDDEDRLLAMMENIVRNNGTFEIDQVRAPKPKRRPRKKAAKRLDLQKPPALAPMQTAQVFGLEGVAPMLAAARAAGLLPR